MRSDLVQGLCVSTLLVLAVLAVLPTRYETNDDLGFIADISNPSTVLNSSHNYYQSDTLRHGLHFLYTLAPQVPWYGIFMYSCLVVSLGLLLSLLLRWGHKRSGIYLLWPLILVLFLYLVLFLNYSAPSLMLLFSVFLCLMDWAIHGSPVSCRKSYAMFLLVAAMAGYLIRVELARYALVFALPLLLFVRPNKIIQVMFWVVPFLILMGWEAGFHHYLLARTSHDKSMSTDYRVFRTEMQDTIKGQYHGDLTQAALAAAGWEEEDYALYNMWVMYDEALFNVPRLRIFLQKNDPGQANDIQAYAHRFLKNYAKSDWYLHMALLGVVMMGVLAWPQMWHLPKKLLLKMGVSLLLVTAGLLYLLFYRFTPRVSIPVILYGLGLGACFLTFPGQQADKPKSLNMRFYLLAGLLLVSIWQTVDILESYVDRLRRSVMEKSHVLGSLDEVNRASEGIMLMILQPGIGLRLERFHPLKEWGELPEVMIIPTGTGINTPEYYRFLSQLGLSGGRELMAWTLDNGRVLFPLFAMGSRHSDHITGLWESYMNRRIAPGKHVGLVPVHDFRNSRGWGMVYYAMRSGRR